MCGKPKTLVCKVVGNEKLHISTKNGVMIRKFAMVLAVTKLTWVESQVNAYMVPNYVKDYSQKHWYAMFGIFPRYYITDAYSKLWFAVF